jgi:hypothetical protein
MMSFERKKKPVRGLLESGVSKVSGMKGLRFGITKVPSIFYTGKLDIGENSSSGSNLCFPTVDFKDIHTNPTRRVEVIGQIQRA